MISAVIPTLNEEATIALTVRAVSAVQDVAEVIAVDGGSKDQTRELAAAAGARVISATRGRGSQMAAGGEAAKYDVLWFIHADTTPHASAGAVIERTLTDPSIVGGHFRPCFDGDFIAARFLTWLYPHLALLGLKYGDGTLFVRRGIYTKSGGFRPYPLFEDLDLLRRLRQFGRMVQLPDCVVTSSRRFVGRSFGLTFAAWSTLQVLYWLGVSPYRLAKWYPVRR